MGRMVKRLVRYTDIYLELTDEDLKKQRERNELRQKWEISPAVTAHEKRFAECLLKCPICGKTPHYLKIACESKSGYSYKMDCDIHVGSMLGCGDWFDTPSRAGRDWNDRVRIARAKERRYSDRGLMGDDLYHEFQWEVK